MCIIKSNKLACLLLITLFLLVGCYSKSYGANIKAIGTKGEQLSELENEALKQAMPELNKYFIKCGDFYLCKMITFGFSRYNDHKCRYKQFKDATISVADRTTDADRLNGLEWVGGVRMELYGACRIYDSSWSQWMQDGMNQNHIAVFVQKKKGGQWESSEVERNFSDSQSACLQKPITCSDLPE